MQEYEVHYSYLSGHGFLFLYPASALHIFPIKTFLCVPCVRYVCSSMRESKYYA